MESIFKWTLGYLYLVTVPILVLLSQYWSNIRNPINRASKSDIHTPTNESIAEQVKEHEQRETHNDEVDMEELKALKHLYYQLHNIEKFPSVLPQAKKTLIRLLMETGTATQTLPEHENILSVQHFSREALEEFQRRRDINIGKEWKEYNLRRKEGGERELFGDREEATWWLKQIAPVKYVDGAWLGHVSKVTTPFALQKTMKAVWQILSEELGDGDLEKNHVFLYHKLIKTVAPGFPTAETLDFGDPRHRLDELPTWKAAIAQLLVSLFPSEFLPEILGFNLHFEAVSMDTLKAGRELRELGLDPYYFILHISIDNAHSGHTAIAMHVVCEYMDSILKTEGQEAAREAWKRVQAGYLLSMGLPGTAVCPSRRHKDEPRVVLSPVEKEVIRIFKAKAQVVHGIHCSSKVKIGYRSVAEWLEPAALESQRWQLGLLRALSGSKYWICRGDSSKSRFIQELQWNGRMFGSFTQDEYAIMRRWIDQLPASPSPSLSLEDKEKDILSGYPVFKPLPPHASNQPSTPSFSFQNLPALNITDRPIFETFLALWLSHPSLLQEFVSIPWRTKNKLACTIVRILRAQAGFDMEQECVAGMSEVRRQNSLGLAEVGKNMMARQNLSLDTLPSLKHVLQAWPSEFALYMLHMSMKPIEYKGMLIGMATAFAKMHVEIGKSRLGLLSAQDASTLLKIGQRELEGLELCWGELRQQPAGKVYADCCEGYLTARHEIEKCFELSPC